MSVLRGSLLASILLGSVVGCDPPTGPTATQPPPPPPPSVAAAKLSLASSTLSFTRCFGSGCDFEFRLRNTGPGCAANVRGRITIYWIFVTSEADTSHIWAVEPEGIVVRPGGVVTAVSNVSVDISIVKNATRWELEEIRWDDVPCRN